MVVLLKTLITFVIMNIELFKPFICIVLLNVSPWVNRCMRQTSALLKALTFNYLYTGTAMQAY